MTEQVEDQKELIQNKDWDNLIILDACRYDYFEENYPDYLEGDLRKVESPVNPRTGYATTDWCIKVYEGSFEDIWYFSSSPRINSKMEVDGFNASEHFGEIFDLWGARWNEEKGTVLPDEMNEAVMVSGGGKDQIIHYMQPHFPYITIDNPSKIKSKNPEAREKLGYKLKAWIGPHVRDLIGDRRTRKLIDFLGLPPINHMDEVIRDVGEEGLKEAYEENLRIVLESVAELVDDLDGKTVVTSDHGELLGEAGYYGHSYVPNHEKIRYVPWFEIE